MLHRNRTMINIFQFHHSYFIFNSAIPGRAQMWFILCSIHGHHSQWSFRVTCGGMNGVPISEHVLILWWVSLVPAFDDERDSAIVKWYDSLTRVTSVLLANGWGILSAETLCQTTELPGEGPELRFGWPQSKLQCLYWTHGGSRRPGEGSTGKKSEITEQTTLQASWRER